MAKADLVKSRISGIDLHLLPAGSRRRPARALGAILIMTMLACLAGCAPKRHVPREYRFDPVAAEQLEQLAANTCEEAAYPAGKPSRPFITDGCSVFPDGAWQQCCVTHDMAYWCGGSRTQRKLADEALRQCVDETVDGWLGESLAKLMRLGVVAGGAPWLPTRWRWGYGHPFPKRYSKSDWRDGEAESGTAEDCPMP
jgi:hypothetical protein